MCSTLEKSLAYCGLNCETCEARIATVNDDNNLRELVAKKWSAMNHCTITAEMINCLGCKGDGLKCYYCSDMCEIRKCAISRQFDSCASCGEMATCTKLAPFLAHTRENLENIKKSL